MTVTNEQPRSILPVVRRRHVGTTTHDAKDPSTSYPPIKRVRPPLGSPHVLVVLLDDVGFGGPSACGGPCHTPTADRLAARGLTFTRFHTTGLCAPTRQSLLTGRNHHSVAMGSLPEFATSLPGYTTVRPDTAATLPEILKLNGYSTAQFGKCHEVPVWEANPMGPFRQWPTGSGFEHFYGFIGAQSNQYYPAIYEDTMPIQPPRTPEEGYHFTEDMTDKAIAWVREQRSLTPDKPWFVYFAPGATHVPHHVPTEWADMYRDRFVAGWDALRLEILARQQELGVIPTNAALPTRPAEIPAWDDMPDDLKPVLCRQMEVYAGFLEHTDYHVGRLTRALSDLGILQETLIFYILGDNGGCPVGAINGSFNGMACVNGADELETPEFMVSRLEDFGGPKAYNHYAAGWAHAMSTPYQWMKIFASHYGGTRNGAIVHWPNGFAARGELRTQFHHVIDVAPSILEASGIPEPAFVHGVQQQPMEGVTMRYCFDDPSAGERRETQYFEIFCNRGIYHRGWTAVTRHSNLPWQLAATVPALDHDVWELYDTNADWTQSRDLAREHPDKLRELQRRFLIEAAKYSVLPLDDRVLERLDADIAGRPAVVEGSSQLLFGGMRRLTEGTMLDIKNRSHSVTAEIIVPDERTGGVIIAQGGAFGGWVLFMQDNCLSYCYNFLGLHRYKVRGTNGLFPGTHQVHMDFTYDGGGLGRGGEVVLFVDGEKVAEGRVEATQAMIFSVDETCDVGCDTGTAVSEEYTPATSAFTGTVSWVRLDVDRGSAGHFATVADRIRVAMELH